MPDPTTESLNYLGSDTDKMFAQVPDVYEEEVVNQETSPITRVVDATEIKKDVPQGLNPDLVAEFYVAVARQEGFKGGVKDYSEVLAKDKGAQLKAFSHAKQNGFKGTQEDLMKLTGIQTPVKKKDDGASSSTSPEGSTDSTLELPTLDFSGDSQSVEGGNWCYWCHWHSRCYRSPRSGRTDRSNWCYWSTRSNGSHRNNRSCGCSNQRLYRIFS